MTALGDIISVSINGTRFKAVKDAEPEIIPGGTVTTEMQEYGDGTADPIKTIKTGQINGLQVFVDIPDEDAFKAALAADAVPVVVECTRGSYETTGCIVGEDITISAKTRKSSEFEVHCTDGGGVRASV